MIVLVTRTATGVRTGSPEAIRAAGARIDAWRAANGDKLLSAAQVDAHLAEERSSWDER